MFKWFLTLMVGAFITSGTNVYAQEVLKSADGRLVKLNPDFTWEYVKDGIQNKVVFSISEATDFYEEYEIKKDSWGNFESASYFFGCRYQIAAENKTDYEVKVHDFWLQSDNTFMVLYKMDYAKPLAPKDKIYQNAAMNDALTDIEKKRKFDRELTASEIDDHLVEFGCKYFEDTLFLETSKFPDYPYFLEFHPSTGLTGPAAFTFAAVGEGVDSLKEKIINSQK